MNIKDDLDERIKMLYKETGAAMKKQEADYERRN